MNRRGNTRLVVGVLTAAMTIVAGAASQIPEPEGWWPQSWAGWATVVGLLGTVVLVFGPFMKERLRKFLCDAETLLLLSRLVIEILKTDDTGLVLKNIVIKQFPERLKESVEMWQKIDLLEEEVASMRQSFEERIEPTLNRIEQSTDRLHRELESARIGTAEAIAKAIQAARDDFRDHGGRRANPR